MAWLERAKNLLPPRNAPPTSPSLCISDHWTNWTHFVTEIPDRIRHVIDAFLPGPLTVILPDGSDSGVGVRCPANTIARELIQLTGPLIASSANRRGAAPLSTARMLSTASAVRWESPSTVAPARLPRPLPSSALIPVEHSRFFARD